MINRLILLFATGLGLGFIPGAPGTYGALLGIPLALAFFRHGITLGTLSLLALIFFSIWTAGKGEEILGRPDASQIVIDEIAGMAVALFLIPLSAKNIIIGFVLFRFFDIIKIGPVKWVDQRLPGGWGIVGDDLVAGTIANLLLRLIILIW